MSKTRPTKRARDETSVDANNGETSSNKLQGNESQKATIREKKEISELIKNGSDQVALVTEPSHEQLSDKFVRVVLNGNRVKFAYTLCCNNLYSQPLSTFNAELVNRHKCPDIASRPKKQKRGLLDGVAAAFIAQAAARQTLTVEDEPLKSPVLKSHENILALAGVDTDVDILDGGSSSQTPMDLTRSSGENSSSDISFVGFSSTALLKPTAQVDFQPDVCDVSSHVGCQTLLLNLTVLQNSSQLK